MIIMMLSLAFFVVVMPTQAAAGPYIHSITPTQHAAGTFTLKIYGSGFDIHTAVDKVYWNADGHFVGRGYIKYIDANEIWVTEYMSGAERGYYSIAIQNLISGQESNRKTFRIY